MDKKFSILTFGCQMNEADSDIIRQLLLQNGYVETYVQEEADYLIFNTCAIRERADTKAVGRITELQRFREINPRLKIVVSGCIPQLEGDSFAQRVSGIDLLLGTSNFYRLPEYLARLERGEKSLICLEDPSLPQPKNLPPAYHGQAPMFLPITRGCNNFCAYCVVPYARGREGSLPAQVILEQLTGLIDQGCQEVTLVGQNVNSYRDGEVDFNRLLNLAAATGIKRLRFITSHPKDMSFRIIDTVAAHANICPHFHLPLQSGSDAVLQRMNRQYDQRKYLALTNYIRQTIPFAFLTTDIIVGFPGETSADFQETLYVMEEAQFSLSYMFKYSPRPKTKAFLMPDDVPEAEKQRRLEIIMAKHAELSLKQNERFLGKTVEALVEGHSHKNAQELRGRLSQSLTVIFKGEQHLLGRIIPVKITAALVSALKGEILVE